MDQVWLTTPAGEDGGSALRAERAAPRFALLIRPAKLVSPQGEFICVIRDVSATGISLRGFHRLPGEGPFTLELQTGETHAIEEVWRRDHDGGYRFVQAVQVHDFIAETGLYPKRKLRLGVHLPVTLSWHLQHHRARLCNLSQQGARVECDSLFAIEQPLRMSCEYLPELVARVRWRQEGTYGVVFDNTFSLKQLALLGAGLQAPELLAEPGVIAAQRNLG